MDQTLARQSDSQTDDSGAERADVSKHRRESRLSTVTGMRYLRRNLETMRYPRNHQGEKRSVQHWKKASASNLSEPNGSRDDGNNRFVHIRANQRQSYHDEGHSESVQVKRERESSPDLEELLFAPLTTETPAWTRSSPADVYYQRDLVNPHVMKATPRIAVLADRFEHDVLRRTERALGGNAKYEPPSRKIALQHVHRHSCCGKKKGKDEENGHHHHHKHGRGKGANSGSGGGASAAAAEEDSSSSSPSSSEDEEEDVDVTFDWMNELERKKRHPRRVHPELWFNEPAQLNDGPICRCSLRARKSGIRHIVYPGEMELRVAKCEPDSNNGDKLFHYRVVVSPHTNFLLKNPTVIDHDGHDYIFEGFSVFTHHPVGDIPDCRVIRFNIEYTLHLREEKLPDNFAVRELELFKYFVYEEVLELMDLDWALKTQYKLFDEFALDTSEEELEKKNQTCSLFHLMPRFARDLPDNGKELLSMNQVLLYLLKSSKPLISEKDVDRIPSMSDQEWKSFVGEVRGTIVTQPGRMPSSVRVDQVDREVDRSKSPSSSSSAATHGQSSYPEFVHFGIRPAQLSYAGDPKYQKAWKQYVKLKHLLYNKPKITDTDREKLEAKLEQLQDIRTKSSMKREVTVAMSSQGWYRTGLRSDVTQHALVIPVLTSHIRFHRCLKELEQIIGYSFKDRRLLQLALTHPSYRVNYGTNPDHARNALSNCGIRQPNYGDRSIHFVNSRKRGINTLIYIMSKMGQKQEKLSDIMHNERLEYLGDAVVEFLTSIHLFFMFPDLEEGGLSTYRAAIVQNQHLAVLAKKLRLQDFMLYAHGPDLCHDSDLKHAMANCYEALMGAVYLDSGIKQADQILARCLFPEDHLYNIWMNLPRHPLQEQEPEGDRRWIQQVKALEKLTEFEEAVGVQFTHIRLLARAFTLRSVGYNNLCLGHNQRMEFLGDTILQLIASDYLYRHFPEHHEGHLSLLRSSLVNNRTQAQVFDDLGMEQYVIHANDRKGKFDMKSKERADVLEALLGALYVDKDLEYCKVLCNVCFFPRLESFILNQEWNDPKSQLQQCCLTLRSLEDGEPDIPVYKVVESKGPTNTRTYTVAVYFRGVRLAKGHGHSIQQAEMDAASNALAECRSLFPQLEHQKRVIEKKYNFYKSGKGLSSVGPVGAKIHHDKKDEEWNRTKERKLQQLLDKLDKRNKDEDRAKGIVDEGPEPRLGESSGGKQLPQQQQQRNQQQRAGMMLAMRQPPQQYKDANQSPIKSKQPSHQQEDQQRQRHQQPVGEKRNWARDKQVKSRYLEESSSAAAAATASSASTQDKADDIRDGRESSQGPSMAPTSSSTPQLNGHPDDTRQTQQHHHPHHLRDRSASRDKEATMERRRDDGHRDRTAMATPHASRSRESNERHHHHSDAPAERHPSHYQSSSYPPPPSQQYPPPTSRPSTSSRPPPSSRQSPLPPARQPSPSSHPSSSYHPPKPHGARSPHRSSLHRPPNEEQQRHSLPPATQRYPSSNRAHEDRPTERKEDRHSRHLISNEEPHQRPYPPHPQYERRGESPRAAAAAAVKPRGFDDRRRGGEHHDVGTGGVVVGGDPIGRNGNEDRRCEREYDGWTMDPRVIVDRRDDAATYEQREDHRPRHPHLSRDERRERRSHSRGRSRETAPKPPPQGYEGKDDNVEDISDEELQEAYSPQDAKKPTPTAVITSSQELNPESERMTVAAPPFSSPERTTVEAPTVANDQPLTIAAAAETTAETTAEMTAETTAGTTVAIVTEMPAETTAVTTTKTTAEITAEKTAMVAAEKTVEVTAEKTAEVTAEKTAEITAETTERTVKTTGETTMETGAKTITETAAETTTETDTETIAKATTATTAETSPKTIAETSPKIIAETSAKTIAETSAKTIADTSIKTITETTAKTIAETSAKTFAETTAETTAKPTAETTAKPTAETTTKAIAEMTTKTIAETTAKTTAEMTAKTTTVIVAGASVASAVVTSPPAKPPAVVETKKEKVVEDELEEGECEEGEITDDDDDDDESASAPPPGASAGVVKVENPLPVSASIVNAPETSRSSDDGILGPPPPGLKPILPPSRGLPQSQGHYRGPPPPGAAAGRGPPPPVDARREREDWDRRHFDRKRDEERSGGGAPVYPPSSDRQRESIDYHHHRPGDHHHRDWDPADGRERDELYSDHREIKRERDDYYDHRYNDHRAPSPPPPPPPPPTRRRSPPPSGLPPPSPHSLATDQRHARRDYSPDARSREPAYERRDQNIDYDHRSPVPRPHDPEYHHHHHPREGSRSREPLYEDRGRVVVPHHDQREFPREGERRRSRSRERQPHFEPRDREEQYRTAPPPPPPPPPHSRREPGYVLPPREFSPNPRSCDPYLPPRDDYPAPPPPPQPPPPRHQLSPSRDYHRLSHDYPRLPSSSRDYTPPATSLSSQDHPRQSPSSRGEGAAGGGYDRARSRAADYDGDYDRYSGAGRRGPPPPLPSSSQHYVDRPSPVEGSSSRSRLPPQRENFGHDAAPPNPRSGSPRRLGGEEEHYRRPPPPRDGSLPRGDASYSRSPYGERPPAPQGERTLPPHAERPQSRRDGIPASAVAAAPPHSASPSQAQEKTAVATSSSNTAEEEDENINFVREALRD